MKLDEAIAWGITGIVTARIRIIDQIEKEPNEQQKAILTEDLHTYGAALTRLRAFRQELGRG